MSYGGQVPNAGDAMPANAISVSKSEEKADNKCRRGVAIILTALGYRPDGDDDLNSNLQFLDNFKKRLMSRKKLRIKFTANGCHKSRKPSLVLDNDKGLSSSKTFEPQELQKKLTKTQPASWIDKGKSVIITEDEPAGSSSGLGRTSASLRGKRSPHPNDDDYGRNYDRDYKRRKITNYKKVSPNENVVETNVSDVDRGFIDGFVTALGGSNVELVIERVLTATDVTENNGRLFMPFNQLETSCNFLMCEERQRLDRQEQQSVRFFDPKMREVEGMILRQWNMNTSKGYVLRTKWNYVVKSNGLREGMTVQLWSFRVGDALCLILHYPNHPS